MLLRMSVEKPSRSESMPNAPSRRASEVRLAVVVSADERRLFLDRHAGLIDELAIPVSWLDAGAAGAAAALRELNPAILLTGWSTPPLSAAWLGEERCALRYVCHLAGAVRWLVPRSFLERGGLVSNWSDLPSAAVAEHGLLLALAALRNLGRWQGVVAGEARGRSHIEWLGTRTMFRRRVGIHGFGRVARALVRILRPFDVDIEVCADGVPRGEFAEAGVRPLSSLAELFRRSEVLFECEALNPATTGSVSAAMLAALPDGAVFVNVARGALVDEAALLGEARSGRIRVALDVVQSEPVDETCDFLQVPGVVFSPHIGGPCFDQYPRCGEFALRNIARHLRGEEPLGRVSLDEYDRST